VGNPPVSTVPPASIRDPGSARSRNPAGTSSSAGPSAVPVSAPSAVACLDPFGTSQDYYE
jgi:hypothetical protein